MLGMNIIIIIVLIIVNACINVIAVAFITIVIDDQTFELLFIQLDN